MLEGITLNYKGRFATHEAYETALRTDFRASIERMQGIIGALRAASPTTESGAPMAALRSADSKIEDAVRLLEQARQALDL